MKKKLLPILSAIVLLAFTSCSQNNMSGTALNKADGIAAEGGAEPPGAVVGDKAPSDGGALDDSFDMILGDYEEASGDELFEDANGISEGGSNISAGTLTSGEWIDNNHYSFWQNLYQKEETGWESYRKTWDRSYSSRVFVTVAANGKPVENETVTINNQDGEILWTAKTDNEGKAYLFYNASELSKGDITLKTESGGETKIASENSSEPVSVDLGINKPSGKKSLELSLVVDTTGSMGDELSYLQKELESVLSRAAKDNGNIQVRLSVTFYRDDGDEYIVRNYDFTDNISEAIKNLNAQEADGGGDTPEKVNAALDAAINKLSWSEDSTKLMFIILDAPPHSDDSEAVVQMNTLTEQAAAKGIRLIPILASGGDKETEFLMRDFALKTGGSYLFLTDDSGISAGQHIEPTVGNYTVEKLNDLMVKVINRYLKNADKPAEHVDEKVEEQKPQADPQQGDLAMRLQGFEGSDDNLIAKFILDNQTDNDYTYGYHFELEKFYDGHWVTVERLEPLIVIEIAVLLNAGDSSTFEAPIGEYYYGELSEGEYRIVLRVFGESETKTLYGEFGKNVIID